MLQFSSLHDFMTMGGHGGYVWFCYSVATLVITGLFAQPLLAKKQFIKQQGINLKRGDLTRQVREVKH